MDTVQIIVTGNITLIDAQIGEILEVIHERGELDRIVIIHSSDHGEMNGDYGLIYKSNFLNGAVRVPLIVRTPETLRKNTSEITCDSPVEWFDIGPTLVEFGGGEMQHRQFGKSLRPVLDNPASTHREYAISELSGEIMLLNNDWKIALNRKGECYLLFDVQNDPDETNNLAGLPDMKEIETALRLQVLEHLFNTQTKK